MIIDYWLLITDQWQVVTDYWVRAAEYYLLAIRIIADWLLIADYCLFTIDHLLVIIV